jgi:GT2 family glycosyltransferase
LKLDYNFWGETLKHPKDDFKPYMIGAGGHGGFAITRSLWDAVGGYGPANLFFGYGGEEMVFDLKLWRMGHKVFIDPKVIHYHYPGGRGYSRHHTDEYYANLLASAHVIGGEKWLYKVFDSFITRNHFRLKPKKHWYDILEEAYFRSAEYAQELDAQSVMTLDEVLEWFRFNGVAH